MRWVGFSLVGVVSVAAPLLAQSTNGRSNSQLGAVFDLALPQGDFAQFAGTRLGIDLWYAYAFDPGRHFRIRVDAAGLIYGDQKQSISLGPYIPGDAGDLETTNGIYSLAIGPHRPGLLRNGNNGHFRGLFDQHPTLPQHRPRRRGLCLASGDGASASAEPRPAARGARPRRALGPDWPGPLLEGGFGPAAAGRHHRDFAGRHLDRHPRGVPRRCDWILGLSNLGGTQGRCTPQAARSVSLISPNVARTRTACRIGGIKGSLPWAAFERVSSPRRA
jgi:hypothetical protein